MQPEPGPQLTSQESPLILCEVVPGCPSSLGSGARGFLQPPPSRRVCIWLAVGTWWVGGCAVFSSLLLPKGKPGRKSWPIPIPGSRHFLAG